MPIPASGFAHHTNEHASPTLAFHLTFQNNSLVQYPFLKAEPLLRRQFAYENIH